MNILFVWDFHGVLEKGNVYAVQKLCNLVLDDFGIDKKISIDEAVNWYGLSWFDYFKLAAPQGDFLLWQEMTDKVLSLQQKGWDIIKKHLRPREYACETLKTIQEQGHQNILLSNTQPEHIRRFTDLIDMSQYFNNLIGCDFHRDSRIDKDIHNIKSEALSNFIKDKNYNKVVAIGDKESDIKAAKSCGATTYLFFDQEIDKPALNTEANYVISDLREVLKEL